MGCGSTKVDASDDNQHDYVNTNNDKNALRSKNGMATKESKRKQIHQEMDTNANTVLKKNSEPVPKAIAFDVSLDGQNTELFFQRKPLTRRLQTLEPLNVPQLSAEMLAEKQKQAEEKRERMRQKRASASRKASKRRQELMKAKDFEIQQQLQKEKALDEQQRMVEAKREANLKEIQEKQRIREERARQARERVQRLNQDEEVDIEKEDDISGSDNDSWLGDEDRISRDRAQSSPKKKLQERNSFRPTASASTVDSYDAAFQRQPKGVSESKEQNGIDDNFFDT